MGNAAASRSAPLAHGGIQGGPRTPGSGRKAGAPNRVTKSVKDAILKVYAMVGGDEGLAEWARENRTEFYKLYARLLPIQLTATDANRPIEIRLVSFSDSIPEHMRASQHDNAPRILDAEVTPIKPLAVPRGGG